MDHDAVAALARALRKAPLFGAVSHHHAVSLGRAEIERMLRHRDPFLLVDAVTALDLDRRCIAGHRLLRREDPVFAGHFPGEPVYPGVLQIEAVGQLGLYLAGALGGVDCAQAPAGVPVDARILKIKYAEFILPVLPGRELTLQAQLVEENGFTGIIAGQVLTGEAICSLTVMEVYFVTS